MVENKDWQHQAIALANTGVMSRRQIAEFLKVKRSTCLDFLRAYYSQLAVVEDKYGEERVAEMYYEPPSKPKHDNVFRIVTDPSKSEGTHLFISDTQVKPGISLDYLGWLGQYIVRKQPDVIVLAGDHADMPSLSSYDKGKKSAEGKRVQDDVDAAIEGMKVLLKPLYDMQQQQLRETKDVTYTPRLILTLGNHEDRINRHVESNPELFGFLSTDDLRYEDFGWEVVPFLTPVEVGGIYYCHYFPNVMTGRALTGTAANMLKTIGKSFSMGHRQVLDVATRFTQADGSQQWGLVSGAYYDHQEGYKGVQGNHHWRGCVLKHNVRNGSYDPLFISLEWLREEYAE